MLCCRVSGMEGVHETQASILCGWMADIACCCAAVFMKTERERERSSGSSRLCQMAHCGSFVYCNCYSLFALISMYQIPSSPRYLVLHSLLLHPMYHSACSLSAVQLLKQPGSRIRRQLERVHITQQLRWGVLVLLLHNSILPLSQVHCAVLHLQQVSLPHERNGALSHSCEQFSA